MERHEVCWGGEEGVIGICIQCYQFFYNFVWKSEIKVFFGLFIQLFLVAQRKTKSKLRKKQVICFWSFGICFLRVLLALISVFFSAGFFGDDRQSEIF